MDAADGLWGRLLCFLDVGVLLGVNLFLDFAELGSHAVIDDADGGEGGEVGEELDIEGVEVVITLAYRADYLADRDSFGECSGESAGDDGVALMKLGMARKFLKHCTARILAFPHKRAELFAPLDLGGEAQVGIEQRDDARRVRTDYVDYAHHAVLVHDSHLGAYAVKRTLLDGDIVVGAGYGVVDDVSHDEVVARQRGVYLHRIGVFAVTEAGQLVAQLEYLLFQLGIASLEVFVDVAQTEIRGDRAGGAVHT